MFGQQREGFWHFPVEYLLESDTDTLRRLLVLEEVLSQKVSAKAPFNKKFATMLQCHTQCLKD